MSKPESAVSICIIEKLAKTGTSEDEALLDAQLNAILNILTDEDENNNGKDRNCRDTNNNSH